MKRDMVFISRLMLSAQLPVRYQYPRSASSATCDSAPSQSIPFGIAAGFVGVNSDPSLQLRRTVPVRNYCPDTRVPQKRVCLSHVHPLRLRPYNPQTPTLMWRQTPLLVSNVGLSAGHLSQYSEGMITCIHHFRTVERCPINLFTC